MVDPVIAANGNTYERTAMEDWLRHHTTSPSTGKALKHHRLTPNLLFNTVKTVVMTSAATQ